MYCWPSSSHPDTQPLAPADRECKMDVHVSLTHAHWVLQLHSIFNRSWCHKKNFLVYSFKIRLTFNRLVTGRAPHKDTGVHVLLSTLVDPHETFWMTWRKGVLNQWSVSWTCIKQVLNGQQIIRFMLNSFYGLLPLLSYSYCRYESASSNFQMKLYQIEQGQGQVIKVLKSL